MSIQRILRATLAGIWIGLKAIVMYLLVWPIWTVVTVVIWLLSIWFGTWFALLVMLCPGDKLQQTLIDHSQFWFRK